MRSFTLAHLLVIAALAPAAAADTINVPGDAATIQGGIDLALAGDEVVVAPGTYNEHVNMLGKAITLRSVDPFDPATVAATILDGGGTGIVITCTTGEGPGTVVTGLTITGGFTSASGGGMLNDGASPTVSACVFVGNQGNTSGGAIANNNAAPHITGCTFNGNTSFGNGGAIVNASSDAVVEACLFVANTVDASGGAIANLGGTPHITGCTFDGNAADVAGGIGGAILNASSNAVVDSCLFVGNQSTFNGGAIVSSNGSPIVVNSVFSGNTAGFEGGAMRITGNAFPAVVNCTFSGNAAANAGDAIRAQMTGGELTITNCILWNGGADEVVAGGVGATTVTYSDIQGGFAGAGNIDADPLFVDADGADDVIGTSDDDLRLAAYSPCADAGDNTASGLSGVSEDLEGLPRFVDDGNVADTGVGTPPLVDMGAYERQEESHRVLVLNPGDSIQAAIDDPLTNDGDTIILNPGTYNEAINLRGKAITIQSTNPDDPPFTTTLFKLGTTVITCNSGETAETVIKGLVIKGSFPSTGRGMLNDGASPTVTNCVFSQGKENKGGGMRNNNGARPLVTDCTFSDNDADEGGAMHNENGSSPTLIGCVFERNETVSSGGAIASFNGSSVVATACTFQDNTALGAGGAMYNFDESNVILTECNFVGNSGISGGGLIGDIACLMTLRGCTFDSNEAGRGGGISAFLQSHATITNCVFVENKAHDFPPFDFDTTRGGAIHAFNDCDLTITNCTFTRNSSDEPGGALWAANGGSATFTNCVLWSDTPSEITLAGGGASATVSNSIVDGGYAGVGVLDVDPRFVSNNDLRLAGCSPAIDAGDNFAANLVGLTTDADGAPRFVDDAGAPDVGVGSAPFIDLGAYERQEDTSLFFMVTPADSVQAVIDLACPGAEIVLAEGTYNEALTLPRSITLRSTDPNDPAVVAATVLDGTGLGASIITCDSGETVSTVVSGLTIANAFTLDDGGGLHNIAGSPTVAKCAFLNNYASIGGAVHNEFGGTPTLIDCQFIGNGADLLGGAISNFNSSPTLINCVLSGNEAGVVGGGMYSDVNSDPTLINCTLAGNVAPIAGGGLLNIGNSNATVTNCIFWGDSPDEIADFDSVSVVSYSDIAGGFAGVGNIAADPVFVDADGADGIVGTSDDDLRLDAGSPCIDAANYDAYANAGGESIDLNGDPRTHDDAGIADTGTGALTYLDMGAYEFQDDSGVVDCPGDLSGDNMVDLTDLGILLANYGTGMLPEEGDLSGDGVVDLTDLGLLLADYGVTCP